LRPTDVSNPQYYHKVVDCQWACPAHTNVPEYIRLIANGHYTDARQAIFRFIETWYNRKRRHSTLDYLSPIQYEQQLRMAA